jgi:hypothetical protein
MGREWGCTDGTDGTVISESPLKARVLGNFRIIGSIGSIGSMRCAAPREKPPQHPLAGGAMLGSPRVAQ